MALFRLVSLCLLLMSFASAQETTGCETREFSRMCSNMGYNKIRVPNSLGHKSVSAAELALHEFFPLLKVGCSPQLQPFLCSIHFPQCHETELVLPCRSLCEQARSGCDSIMNRFGFKWPETFGCEKLPETGNCFYPDLEMKESAKTKSEEAKSEITTLKKKTGNELSEKIVSEETKSERGTLKKSKDLERKLSVKTKSERAKAEITTLKKKTGCEPVTSRMCSNIGYNKTRVPNSLGHKSVSAAELEMHEFFPLLKVGCSPQLLPFLCSIHFPQCHETELALPCRSLCEQARSGCDSLMKMFGFKWPETLGCEKLPETGNCFYAGKQLSNSDSEKQNAEKTNSEETKSEKVTLEKSKELSTPNLERQRTVNLKREKTKSEEANLKIDKAGCEAVNSRMCSDIGYNMTRIPNSLGHNTVAHAALEVTQFYPLVRANCSPQLQPFLCSLYFPQCHETELVLPCRSLCEQARSGCESLMNRFGFKWPEAFRCDKLQESGNCFHPGKVLSSSKLEKPKSKLWKSERAKSKNSAWKKKKVLSSSKLKKPKAKRWKSERARSRKSAWKKRKGKVLSKSKLKNPRSKRWKSKRAKSRKSAWKERKGSYLRKKWRKSRMLADQPDRTDTSLRQSRGRGSGLVKGCLSFESEFCPNIPYDLGGFPNLLGHKNPDHASNQLRALLPLMRTGCSPRLHDFLCGVHFPQCYERKVTGPCRSLCLEVSRDCSGALAKLGFAWPQRLRCNRFPQDDLCFGQGSKAIILPPPGLVDKSSSSPADKPSSGTSNVSNLKDEPATARIGSVVAEIFNATIANPFMEWLYSSTKLNKDQAKLAQEQAQVAKLTEQKLTIEISHLKKGHGHKEDPAPP